MKKEQRPHILIVLVDQHRADCVGINGNRDIQTPNLDNLARAGKSYTNCYSTFPLCTPARYSLMTGLYVRQHMGWGNRSTISKDLPTFAKLLKETGYETDYIGKIHSHPTYADLGFEQMLLAEQEGPGRFEDDYHRDLKANDVIDFTDMQDQIQELRKEAPNEYYHNFGTEPSDLKFPLYSTDWIGQQALKHIEKWQESSESPQMLVVGFIKPHHPFDAPAPWRDRYNPNALTNLPGWSEAVSDLDYAAYKGFFDNKTLTPEVMKECIRQYYASITHIDDYVGKFVDLLKKKGIYNNTLILYVSDHGEYMGYHHLMLKNNYIYDPVIKVPLIVKYPSSHPSSLTAGSPAIDSKLVSIIDATATILECAGIEIPKPLDSNITPLHQCDRTHLIAENLNSVMVRSKDFKLIKSDVIQSCLFDLNKDPQEFTNLYDDPKYQDIKKELLRVLEAWEEKAEELDSAPELAPLESLSKKKGWNFEEPEKFNPVKKWYFDKYKLQKIKIDEVRKTQ